MLIGAYVFSIFTIPVDQRPIVYQYYNGGIIQFTMPFFLAMILGGLVAALFAFLIGLPVLRLKSDYLAIYNNHVAPDNEFVRIGYGGAAELPRAQKLVRLLKERAGLTDEQIQLTHVSPIVGAHTGSTVLSFFFKQTDER